MGCFSGMQGWLNIPKINDGSWNSGHVYFFVKMNPKM